MFDRNVQVEKSNPSSFWISYADVLSSLLIIILFITVYVIYELMTTKRVVVESLDEITQAEIIRREVLEEIKITLEQEGITVEVADNFSVLRIPETTLSFESNQYFIPVEMEADLGRIGEVLLNELMFENRSNYFDTIFIEGHTDIRPSRRELGNWGLSTFRAISVWNFWIENVNRDFEILSNNDGLKLFSVSGYGESRPSILVQRTEDDYMRNRRIDVRFTLRKPSSLEYQGILNLFESE